MPLRLQPCGRDRSQGKATGSFTSPMLREDWQDRDIVRKNKKKHSNDMNKQICITLLLPLVIVSFSGSAQMTRPKTDSLLIGTWKGSSICQIKNSPCHDETVVYHISKLIGNDTFYIQADKIVNGKPEDMGILPCLFDEKRNRLTSSAYGTWSFLLKNNEMDGTLISRGQLYRIIKLSKVL